MTTPSGDIEFNTSVENWILRAINAGHTRFGAMLTSLPGVYPSIVLSSMRALSAGGRIPTAVMLETEASISVPQGVPETDGSHIQLPVPHPLDYEWRFSDSAIIYILQRISEFSGDNDPITLLGTPSVLRSILETGLSRDVRLLDKNEAILESFRKAGFGKFVEHCDFGEYLPIPNESRVVVVDPPWYEAHLKLFTWTAQHMCRIDGRIIVSLPAEGTRPGVNNEVTEYLGWAEKELGLSVYEHLPGVVAYKTPPFERNALMAEGILGFPYDWRRGNLVVFHLKNKEKAIPRPELQLVDNESWNEISWGRMRVRIRQRNPPETFADPALLPVVKGDVLPSVSRRDNRRSLVDIWTSGNRVFACKGTRALSVILEGLSAGLTAGEIVDRFSIDRVENQRKLVFNTIQQLTDLYDKEHKDYLHH